MKKAFYFSPRKDQARKAAFTLIELLAVMAIIVLLASLILGIASHANYKASMSRAQTEVHAIGAAIENYKVDNGNYPRSGLTDKLDPQRDWDPSSDTAQLGDTSYKRASQYLYQALSGFQPDGTGKVAVKSPPKGYMAFQPNQLEIMPNSNERVKTPLSPNMYIVDPFGFSYGYSTVYLMKVDEANDQNPGAQPTPGYGYNPTFDLWSTAGYAKNGKSTPSNNANASPAAIYSSLWLKNW